MNTNYANILEAYELSSPLATLGELKGDSASSNVRLITLENGQKWIVKSSIWYEFLDSMARKAALETAYHTSELLRLQGVPLARVLKNRNDSFIYTQDKIDYTIQEFIEGRDFNGRSTDIGAYGKALGIFHKKGAELLKEEPELSHQISSLVPTEKPYEESRVLYEDIKEAVTAPHTCSAPEVCNLVRNSFDLIERFMHDVDSSDLHNQKLDTGILHNDLNTKNLLFNESGKVAGILDTDQLGFGPFVFDIGNAINSFAWELSVHKGATIEEEIALFLTEYHKINPLPLHEYVLIGVSGTRWDLQRILRTMRRHHFENNRLPKLLQSIQKKFLPRLGKMQQLTTFITPQWIETNCTLPN